MKGLVAALALISAPALANDAYDAGQVRQLLDVFREIAEIAVSVCTAAEASGYRQTDLVVQKTNTGVGKLTQLVVSANAETMHRTEVVRWQGVLQSDIANSIRQTNECRYNVVTSLQKTIFDKSVASNNATAPIVSSLPPPPKTVPAPATQLPSGERPTLRVFLKDNLTERNLAMLRAVLPDFKVVTGRSTIDKRNPADTLFVNRDEVTPAQILEVARALGAMGVSVKSVQQSTTVRGKEIQVGTYPNRFRDKPPLDLDALSQLQGPAFWRAAYNGLVFCSTGVGRGQPCTADADGRPTMRGATR